ncbi:MAG: hypothetical protein H8D22_08305, partial [Candidatus Cloacimonetes bacterium]|nr:hypothetical protein [Candidatus Cloacimonadota bacterium]
MKDIKFLLYILIFILPIILSSQSLQYQYDNLSRLTSVDYGNGTIISYTYDDVGNRLTHIFQSAYHPPNPFVLYLPENGEQGVSTTPQFVWGVATDDDPVDIVLYNLNISEDSTLAQVDYLYEELTDTTFLMPEELNDNTKYFWRVDAVDSYNLVTSSDVWSFTTIQYDFDISGNIGYCFNGTPVPDVTVDLTGDNNYSTPTTESGDYFLVGIPGGNYISTPSKADDLGGLSG